MNKERIQKNLKRIMPNLKDLKVDVSRNPDNSFHSHIKVKLPRREFFAGKDGDNYNESLERSYKAIIRQFHKLKSKNERRKHPKLAYSVAS